MAPKGIKIAPLSITEVYRFTLREEGEALAIQAAALMMRSEVIGFDGAAAVSAAEVGHRYRLPLADSTIYASTRSENLELWTQDADFEGLPHVRYFAKRDVG